MAGESSRVVAVFLGAVEKPSLAEKVSLRTVTLPPFSSCGSGAGSHGRANTYTAILVLTGNPVLAVTARTQGIRSAT